MFQSKDIGLHNGLKIIIIICCLQETHFILKTHNRQNNCEVNEKNSCEGNKQNKTQRSHTSLRKK